MAAAALFFFGWFHPVNMFDNSFLAISTAFVGGACMAFMALFIGLQILPAVAKAAARWCAAGWAAAKAGKAWA